MLAPLDNQVIFKIAFTDIDVFTGFVKDILNIDIVVGKIETEKKFNPKIGNIDFSYDIFAESNDQRVIIEIQKVEVDHHFDRFLHYHYMAVAELQRKAADYKIEQTVYTIVLLTAPYTINTKTGLPIKNDLLISDSDPRDLEGKIVPIYGHKLIFLNPNHKTPKTPKNYADWLDLVYESIHNREDYKVNMENEAIKKAVSLIEYEKLSPEQVRAMKEDASKRATLAIYEGRLEKAEQELLKEKQDKEKAERDKAIAEQKLLKEKARAEQELLKEKQRLDKAILKAIQRNVPIEEIAEDFGANIDYIQKLRNSIN